MRLSIRKSLRRAQGKVQNSFVKFLFETKQKELLQKQEAEPVSIDTD